MQRLHTQMPLRFSPAVTLRGKFGTLLYFKDHAFAEKFMNQ